MDPAVRQRTFDRFFQTGVFARPAKGNIGSGAGRYAFRGPGINNWNFTFQFRREMYNAFNHTQFNGVDATARFDAQGRQINTQFGQITSARSPRIQQLSLRVSFQPRAGLIASRNTMDHRYRCAAFAAVFVALLPVWRPAPASDARILTSPNGQVEFRLFLEKNDRLGYAVAFQAKSVIDKSPLGIVVDGVNLAEGVQLGKTDRYRVNESYPWYGVHSTAVNRCHGARFHIRHTKTGAAYTLEARAYDDGIAFRYIVPGPAGKMRVPDEATVFRLPPGSTVWYHDFEGHYEGIHEKKAIGDVPSGAWAAPPLTVRLPGGSGYASITEGALLNYAGMGFQADGQQGFRARLGHSHPASYPFRLRYKEDVQRLTEPAAIAGTITTPWRVIMTGADLNTLVNCDIVPNVSPPPDPKLFPKGLKPEWIRPGRSVWKYLDGGENTFENMKEFSRLAGELGFEYNLVEGFWQKWSEPLLKELVDYSREQRVGIVLWKHSKDLRDPASRRKFFELCHRAGVAGVKIDFFDHEAKEIVELYTACLKDAAEFKLIVNFHGANKPTGESRAWPNELTREAIRGMESRKTLRAQHDATLPFTRMLAGHADYTPMVFGERRNDTTWAHQIASAALFTSPLLVYGAHPRNILQNPAVEVIKSIPSVWDETIALPTSEIGEIAAFARRRGDVWFVAVMNGATARIVDVPLSFLRAGKYQGVLVRDSAEGAGAVDLQKVAVGRGESIRIDLQAGGGFIGRFSAEQAGKVGAAAGPASTIGTSRSSRTSGSGLAREGSRCSSAANSTTRSTTRGSAASTTTRDSTSRARRSIRGSDR